MFLYQFGYTAFGNFTRKQPIGWRKILRFRGRPPDLNPVCHLLIGCAWMTQISASSVMKNEMRIKLIGLHYGLNEIIYIQRIALCPTHSVFLRTIYSFLSTLYLGRLFFNRWEIWLSYKRKGENYNLYLKLIISESIWLKSETSKTYPEFLMCVYRIWTGGGRIVCIFICIHT